MRFILIVFLLGAMSCNTNKDAGINYSDEIIPPAFSANAPITSGFTPVGKYKTVSLGGGEKPCPLELGISENKNTFSYHFSGHEIDEKGQAIVHIDTISPPTINFLGLKIESEADNPHEPETVAAEWKGDTIIIQNYGNSMNEFTVLDCDAKYIYLVRKRT